MNHDEPFYVCQSCGHEDDPDRFGKFCPSCGVNLDELEMEIELQTGSANNSSGTE